MPDVVLDQAEALEAQDQQPVQPEPEADPARDPDIMQIEIDRLRREVTTLIEQRQRTAELVDEIDAADDLFEFAKADAKKAKETREAAKASLRALIKGDVTVKIDFDEADDGKQGPAPAAAHDEVTIPKARDVVASWGIWQFALTRDKVDKVDVSNLRPLEPELSKRKVGMIEILGAQPYLPLEHVILADGSGYFDCWPLYDTDAWDAMFANVYATAVRDLGEESPDVTARRRSGGELCGITVKCGRRRLVIGPDSEVVRLVFAADGQKGPDGGYAASRLLGAGAAAHGEVLSFPANELADRMAARLAEYATTSTGEQQGFVESLAGDLKVDASEIVKAAKGDKRFDVVLFAAGGTSMEVVRLVAAVALD